MTFPRLDPAIRFERHVTKTDTCWLWTGRRDIGGYGRLWVGDRDVPAHRWSYERFVGPIPEGLQVDHLCRVRECVNPAHLEPVTQAENIRRGVGASTRNATKTHCPRGHAYTPENTMRRKSGQRRCRICVRAQNRECSRRHNHRQKAS
jgi:hypothetical protein